MYERDLIRNIKKQFSRKSSQLIKGIGDDGAVFSGKADECWITSTDLLVENSHFLFSQHEPYLLGRKSIAVNLSDIAAMGGDPKFVLLSLSLSHKVTKNWITEWQRGVQAILDENDCILIGGDTTRGEIIAISVTILGTAKPDTIIYRTGASPSEDIYVTGSLGSSAGGLAVLQSDSNRVSAYPELMAAHFNPTAHVAAGIALAQSGLVTAMQDISDGLSTDIAHICEASGVGAVLHKERLPYTDSLTRLCAEFEFDIFNFVLDGGEDYQLVFTSKPASAPLLGELADSLGLIFHKIGKTQKKHGVYLSDNKGKKSDIRFKGFEHKLA